MLKTMKEAMEKLKGKGNETKVLTGKGSYSSTLFREYVHAMVNDRDYKAPYKGKTGTESTSVSTLITDDIKRTLAAAKYPQKSEVEVLNTTEIATDGLSDAVGTIVEGWLMTGRKFALPPQDTFNGEVYLAPVKGKERTIKVRNIQTGMNMGTSKITTKDSVQVRVKSPVPKHLVTKVRFDLTGKKVS